MDMTRAVHTMALQLLNKIEEFVPFRAIKWSTECRIFCLAICLVAIEDALDLYNTHGSLVHISCWDLLQL